MTLLSRRKTFFDIFPAPEFLLLSSAGIAVTDADTKFVQLRRRLFGDGFELTHSGKASNPQGAVESGLVKDPAKLTPILEELSSRHNIRYVRAALPEEKSYLFTATVGWVGPEGLKDAVAFILEENAPVSLAESVFDFEIVSEDRSANEIKLAVSVLPRSVVEAYVAAFESAGIIPVSFDLESQAVARAVIHRADKRPHLLINLSLGKTGFYVVEDGVVQFSTTPAYGFGGNESHSGLDDLKTEMRKVLAFWNTRTDPLRHGSSEASKSGQFEKKIEKIILCGPGAVDKEFVEKLMGEADVRHALADVWLNLSPDRDYAPKIEFNESLDYASVIGLALPQSK